MDTEDLQIEEIFAIYWNWRNGKKKANKRRWWVHEVLQGRKDYGEFYRLVKELELDAERYHQYFRMSADQMEYLLSLVGSKIRKQDTHLRDSITPKEKLAICIRYLATGSSFKTLAFSYRIGASTVGQLIPEVCDALWDEMVKKYLSMPKTEDEWKAIAANFEGNWNFPHCLGAIDGKHIVVQAPANTGSLHYNYKGSFSVVLMALVDANYKFINIDVGGYGRNSDGGVFANSPLGRHLKANALNMPMDEPLRGAPGNDVPYVIIGDEAFPLMKNLMRPFPNVGLTEERRIFNYRLSRARRVVENAFGILACRWRVFHTKIMVSPPNVNKIVKASCVLHNFLQTTSTAMQNATITAESNSSDTTDGLQNLIKTGNRGSVEATYVRDVFVEYFSSEAGKVHWQADIVRRGMFKESET